MSEAQTCAYDGCFESIKNLCEVCKRSFCEKHSQKGQINTKSGKLQYATLCLDHLEAGFNEELTPSRGLSRATIQIMGLSVIVLIIVIIIIAISNS